MAAAKNRQDAAGPETIGLVAGSGLFPLLAAREARRRGLRVAAVAFLEETDPAIASVADSVAWMRVGQLGKLLSALRRAGVRRAVMCGQVRHTHVFRARPDLRAIALALRLPDTRADSLLRAFAGELSRNGITLLDSTSLLTEHLAGAGALGRRRPDARVLRQIALGWSVAKGISGLDVGQTVVVRKGTVVAVEAVEGTDEAIRRGAALAGPGVVVVKVAKPAQDMRFDVPVVGETTIRVLAEAKAAALAVEAGKTLLLDRAAVTRAADSARVILWGAS